MMSSDSNPLLFYIHVPKTAGTTMKMIIEWLYRWPEIFWVNKAQPIEEKVNQLNEKQIRNLKIVAGHRPYGMHQYFPAEDYQYFTFIREPVDRVISQYYYLKRSPKHKLYPYVNNPNYSLKRLIEENHFQNFNIQTHWLTGMPKSYFQEGHQNQETIDLALDNIKRDFAFVGLNDHFDEGLVILKRLFGWSTPFYAMKNVTKSRDKQADFSQETIDLIKEKNQMDVRIYDYCRNNFFETLEYHKGDKFNSELAQLKFWNQKLGRYKPYRLKLLKDLTIKTLYQGFTRKNTVDVLP